MCRPSSWRTPADPFADGVLLAAELILDLAQNLIGGLFMVVAAPVATTATRRSTYVRDPRCSSCCHGDSARS